jgi:hypothetical protein
MALTMEAVRTYKPTVNLYETARRYIPEGCHIYVRRRENLKSHILLADGQ